MAANGCRPGAYGLPCDGLSPPYCDCLPSAAVWMHSWEWGPRVVEISEGALTALTLLSPGAELVSWWVGSIGIGARAPRQHTG